VLSYSIKEKLEPTIEWLQESLSLDDNALAKVILTQPTLLGLSIPNNLEPTLDFYQECLIDDEACEKLLTRSPVLLAVSLEKRLKPRLDQAIDSQVAINQVCLQKIATYTDEKWKLYLAINR